MRKLYLFFLILSLSIFLKNAHATHALGGDLMYEQTGPNTYDVTLRIYRDCNGILLNNDIDIFWQGSCGSGIVSASRITYNDITPLCPGLPTACQGGFGGIGIEEHIYVATVTIPPSCTDVTFDYTLCCRNHVITTLTDPGTENIYLSTTHFDVTALNNSPVFNNYPAPIVCVNQPVVYNHGVYDPDGDSLYFSPSNCYEANNDSVEYLPGFNGITPLITANPINIHANTGSITFTPTAQQVGVMCILVEEFRDGVKIGETLRDIQFNVIACANVPPVASGINNIPGVDSLNFVISVCENSQVCFDLSFSDSDNDSLNVSWNQEIPAATFVVSNNGSQLPTGTFCWLPQVGDVGLNFFSINIVDDACPIVGSSTYTYTVAVLPNTNSMSLTYGDLVCPGGIGNISMEANVTPDSTYWAPSPSLTIINDTFVNVAPSITESFGAIAFFSESCQITATATVGVSQPPTIQGNANTSNLCNGGTAILTGSGGDSYVWNNGVSDNIAFTPPVGVTDYIVHGVDSNGCTNSDTVQITVNPIIGINAAPGVPICYGDSLTLSGFGALNYTWTKGVVDGVPFMPIVGNTTYIMTGTYINGCIVMDSITILVSPLPIVVAVSSNDSICDGENIILAASGAQTYVWNNGVIDGQNFTPPVGITNYTVNAIDSNGCSQEDSIEIQVFALPNVTASASAQAVCDGNPVTFNASGAQSYVWDNGVQDGVSFIPNASISNYNVIGTSANGCVNDADIALTVNTLPNVAANANQSQVCDGGQMILYGSGASIFTWNNGVIDSQSFTTVLGLNTYIVTGTDVNGCVSSDSIQLMTNSLPTIGVSSTNNTVCEDESVTLHGSGALSYTWNNGVSNGVSFVPPVGMTTYVICGTDTNGCVSHDSIQVQVHPKPVFGINTTANVVCVGQSATLSGTGTHSYTWNNGVIDAQAFVPLSSASNYILTGSNNFGCVNQDSILLTINPLPTIQIAASPNVICAGNLLTLTASGADTYQWTNGIINDLPFLPNPGLNSFQVVGTDIHGCQSQTSTNVMVNPLPDLGANTSDNNICEGTSILLLGSGAQSYSWSNGVDNGISFIPPVGNTTYDVVGTNAHGCQNSASIDITVFPTPTIFAVSTDNRICEGSSTMLYAQGANTYTWSNGINDGDTITPPLGTTTYQVVGEDSNGCVNQDTIAIQVLQNGILNEIPDATVCDVQNHVLSTSSSYIQEYQWGVIIDEVAYDLLDNFTYQGTNTDEFVIGEIGFGEHSFYVAMEGLCGNEFIDTMVLTIHESTPIDSLQDTTLCIHDDNVIFADLDGVNLEWNDGTIGQHMSPTSTGWYSVTFEEPITGCEVSDSMFVEMKDCIDNCVVLVPSGFSPNSDGVNDIFRSISTCDEGFSYFSFTIYDRWGDLVYKTDNAKDGWDGQRQGTKSGLGVYVYNIAYTKELSNETEHINGNVSLVH